MFLLSALVFWSKGQHYLILTQPYSWNSFGPICSFQFSHSFSLRDIDRECEMKFYTVVKHQSKLNSEWFTIINGGISCLTWTRSIRSFSSKLPIEDFSQKGRMSNNFHRNTFENSTHKMHTSGTGLMATRNFEQNMMFVQKQARIPNRCYTLRNGTQTKYSSIPV